MTFIIETERLLMREWTPEDAAALFRVCGDPEVMRYLGDGRAWHTRGQAREWLGRVIAGYRERGYGRWAVVEKESGGVIGSCGFAPLYGGPEIDFGYVFARASWGRGFATEAARACLDYGFRRLNFAEVAALVAPEHRRSRRVLEKVGFEYRGLRLFEGQDASDAYYVAKNPYAGKTAG